MGFQHQPYPDHGWRRCLCPSSSSACRRGQNPMSGSPLGFCPFGLPTARLCGRPAILRLPSEPNDEIWGPPREPPLGRRLQPSEARRPGLIPSNLMGHPATIIPSHVRRCARAVLCYCLERNCDRDQEASRMLLLDKRSSAKPIAKVSPTRRGRG